ncbi:helix-turn-helix domain-containing protein [Streptomyces sp. NPDC048057]|uniref:helix-turn-helix domain-containing protein n=1 Tax=Streptomyces sp. NPDC048057 TaxID=3155628 RepID=UPI0033F9CAE5
MSATMTPIPALFTVKAAAAYLSLGRSTLYELMAAQELPYVKVGRARRLRRAELDAFAARLEPQTN